MLPYAELVRAGDFIFTAGLIDLDAFSPIPYWEMPVRRQAKAIYDGLSVKLKGEGTALGNTVNLLQFFRGRGQTAGYIGARAGYFQTGVPTSTGIGCTDLMTPHAMLQIDGTIVVPRDGMAVQHHAGASGKAGYSHAVSFGDWIFCSGITPSSPNSLAAYPGALGTSVPAEAQVDPNYWFGFPAQTQLKYVMEKKLATVLKDVGQELKDVVIGHIHLENPKQDLAPVVETWNSLYNGKPPLAIISPSNGLGSVGAVLEVTPVAVRSGGKLKVQDIEVKGLKPFCGLGPLARRVGDLVFTGTLTAADDTGAVAEAQVDPRTPYFASQAELEMRVILDRLEAICKAAGGELKNVVRLRLYLSSMSDLPALMSAIHARIGRGLAISATEHAANAGWVPGCTISADAVAHI
jgi:enamine deaminase RidA (YjgF/YER057c/UK114 family)